MYRDSLKGNNAEQIQVPYDGNYTGRITGYINSLYLFVSVVFPVGFFKLNRSQYFLPETG